MGEVVGTEEIHQKLNLEFQNGQTIHLFPIRPEIILEEKIQQENDLDPAGQNRLEFSEGCSVIAAVHEGSGPSVAGAFRSVIQID